MVLCYLCGWCAKIYDLFKPLYLVGMRLRGLRFVYSRYEVQDEVHI